MNYIKEIVSDNPDIATTEVIGTTYEKRDLRVLVLKTSTSQKAVWIGNENSDNQNMIFNRD